MADTDVAPRGWTLEELEQRVIRYRDLVPCYNAFVDTRTPGSEKKENFTIIGPGVSENPAQFVHLNEPHGYNIGGARQPPGCVNSQHSHETAEVFIVHTGLWRFDLGEHGEDAQLQLGPGDVISLPTQTFRGFTNVGLTDGFLFAVLGQDDPGRVTWAPKVFELAKDYGLVLLDDGRLIDRAAGEDFPSGASAMPPTSPETVAKMRRISASEAEGFVARADLMPSDEEVLIIGPGGVLDWPHGFTVTRQNLAAGEARTIEQGSKFVIFVQEGNTNVACAAGTLALSPGDTMSVPADVTVRISSEGGAIIFLVCQHDHSGDARG
jgi:quercetin dioxygenase-like cupin family protein